MAMNRKYIITQYWQDTAVEITKEISSEQEYEVMRLEQERLKSDGVFDLYVIKEVK